MGARVPHTWWQVGATDSHPCLPHPARLALDSVPEARCPSTTLTSSPVSDPQICPRSRGHGWRRKKQRMDGWTSAAAALRKGIELQSPRTELQSPVTSQPSPGPGKTNQNKLASNGSHCVTCHGAKKGRLGAGLRQRGELSTPLGAGTTAHPCWYPQNPTLSEHLHM